MRLPLLLSMVLVTFLISISAVQSSEQAPVLLQSIQADFTQEKHLKILSQPIISTGTFTFQRPQSLRWEYISPIRSILLMHGGEVKKIC